MGARKKVSQKLAVSAEVKAKANEYVDRCTATLFDIVGKKSLHRVARDVSSTYLYKLRDRTRNPSFTMIARVLADEDISFEAFLRRMLEQEWADKPGIERSLTGHPVELLSEWYEVGTGARCEFLAKLAPFVAHLAELPIGTAIASSGWRQQLVALEEQRLQDPGKLSRKLERFSFRLVRHLARQEAILPASLAQLATLLAAWAAAQRIQGLLGLAIRGISLAFPLAERSEDVWAEAFCYQKAAYLSVDLGHQEMALAMINKAAVGLSEVGNEDDLARLAVDRAIFFSQAGQLKKARSLFESGLRRLSADRRHYRAVAHFGLARLARKQGDLTRARQELANVIELHDPQSIEAGYMAWEVGSFELKHRAFETAEQHLRRALGLFTPLGRGPEIASVSFDFAELLFRTKRLDELRAFLGEVLGWLAPWAGSNRALVEPFEELAARLILGSLDLGQIGNARQQLQKAIAPARLESVVG